MELVVNVQIVRSTFVSYDFWGLKNLGRLEIRGT